MEEVDLPEPEIDWKSLFYDSSLYLGIMHGYRLVTEPGTREELKGSLYMGLKIGGNKLTQERYPPTGFQRGMSRNGMRSQPMFATHSIRNRLRPMVSLWLLAEAWTLR
jgi:hypothetical protein